VIHWLVLTGGASSRFGKDKASTEFHGRSLADRAVDAVRAVDAGAPVTLVGPERAGGPAAAIVSMLPEIDVDFVGALAVDMPFAQRALDQVVDVWRTERSDQLIDGWVPEDSSGRHQWLCAVYRRAALVRVAEARDGWGGVALHALVGDLATSVVYFPSSVSLLDIDTPEDFQRALDAAEDLGT
jgi:molybdopterin-guanine dinucleotide biosynthesis protein A